MELSYLIRGGETYSLWDLLLGLAPSLPLHIYLELILDRPTRVYLFANGELNGVR